MEKASNVVKLPAVEPFKITFLSGLGTNKVYAKNLDTHALNLPYYNKYREVECNSLSKLFNTFEKVLDKPHITQILGRPTAHLLRQTDPAIQHRRQKINFDFNLDPYSPITSAYNYVVLDIDKLPSHFQTTQFQTAYEEQSLTPDLIREQVNLILSEVFPSATPQANIPNITRLSGSFGTHSATYQHKFKAHIYIPLAYAIPIETIYLYLSQFDWIDLSPYRNPTQPIFTAAPLASSKALDPLSLSQHNLQRIYLHNPTSPPISPQHLYNYLKKTPPDPSASTLAPNPTPDPAYQKPRYTRAIDLPGFKGVFNRAAEENPEYSINQGLKALEYKQKAATRWLSPSSTSDQPGCILFPEGYVIDFHDNSPLNKLAEERDPRALAYKHQQAQHHQYSAYDIHQLLFNYRNQAKIFQRVLRRLASEDQIYQNYWITEIEQRCSYIVEGIPPQQIELIVDGLVEDIFHNHVSPIQRKLLYETMILKVKSLEITGLKITRADLNDKYQKLAEELSREIFALHPGNKESINADVFKQLVKFSYIRESASYLIQSPDGSKLDLITSTEAVKERLFKLLEELVPESNWSFPKIQANISFIVASTRSMHKAPILIAKDLFAFSPPQKDDTYRHQSSYNISTHKILPTSLREGVLYKLPFTQDRYHEVLKAYENTRFEDTYWGKFLISSLENEEKIEFLRDMFSYLFMPYRKDQVSWGFIGVPRSGKSTIKNIMSQFLPKPISLEPPLKVITDDLSAFHEFTPFARLVIINEFNADEISRSSRLNFVVHWSNQLTGRDNVYRRAMRENVETFTSDAIPLFLSNQLPAIRNQAFMFRLRMLKFNNSFPQTNSMVFQQHLLDDLPYIFNWAMTNPRIQYVNKVPGISVITPKGRIQLEKDEVVMQVNTYEYYFQKFLIADTDGWIAIPELIHYFAVFFAQNKGYSPSDEDLNHQKFGLDRLKKIFPYIKSAKNSKKRTTLFPPVQGQRINGIQGISWKNPKETLEGLKEFEEFIA